MDMKRAMARGVAAVNSLDNWVIQLKAEMSAAKSAFNAGSAPDTVRQHVNRINDLLSRPENQALDTAMDDYEEADWFCT